MAHLNLVVKWDALTARPLPHTLGANEAREVFREYVV